MKSKNHLFNKIVFIIIILISGYLLYYSLNRSLNLSFTHDESFSYIHFVKLPIYKILLNDGPTANNHIVNTLLMKLFGNLFGEKEIWLRLHSNISHLFFIIFSILLVRNFRNPLLKLAGFCLLNFNPYMLDFFSLARGYGLTFIFILSSMFFLLIFISKKQKKHLILAYILAGLSVYSNFTTIYYYTSLLFFSSVYFLIDKKDDVLNIKSSLQIIFRNNREIWIITLIVILLSAIPILELTKHNEFYGHGKSGFWENTIYSVLIASFYDVSYSMIQPKTVLLFEKILSAIIFVTVIVSCIKKGLMAIKEPFVIFSFSFFVTAGIEVLQHILTGSQFISMRGAVFFQILFWTMFLFWLDFLSNQIQIRKIGAHYLISFLSLILLTMAVSHFNKAKKFESTFEWKYESNTRTVIDFLENKIEDKNKKCMIGVNWLFEPTLNFYIESREIDFIEPVTRDGFFNKEYDYFYATKASFSDEVVNNLEIVSDFPVSKTILTDKLFERIYNKHQYRIYSDWSTSDSVFYINGNLLGLWGLTEPEYDQLTIESIFSIPNNKFYLELKAGRVLSFNGEYVEGKTEPSPLCEYTFEPTKKIESEFYIKSPTNEYLVLINDTLSLSNDILMNRLIVNFNSEDYNHGI